MTPKPLVRAEIVLLIGLLISAAAPAAPQDIKVLAREAGADLRAVENMAKGPEAASRLAQAKAKIERVRDLDPAYVELRSLDSRYKRLTGIFGDPEAAAAPAPAGASAPSASESARALKDWEEMAALKQDFITRLEEVIPSYVQNVIYDRENADEALKKIAALKKEAPSVQAKVTAFGAVYGAGPEEIDRKIYALTPKDAKLSLLDPKNQRPDESPGNAFRILVNGLTNLEEAPKIEAKLILTRVLQDLDSIESFVLDTERDKRYADVERRLLMAARFSPQDPEVREWQAKIRTMRAKSKVDIEKTLDDARFPAAFAGFAGPGSASELAASALKYFNQEGGNEPNETTLKVHVAGDWVVAKRNIFGDPIQWGLPIWAAAQRNDDKEICRIFRLTILTGEGPGIAKRPPWTGVWVGDSFRMRARNLK